MLGLVFLTVIRFFGFFYFAFEFYSLKQNFNSKIDNFKNKELDNQVNEHKKRLNADFQLFKTNYETLVTAQTETKLAKWKQEQEEFIRQDAIKKSQSITMGKVTEHLIPYMEGFNYDPRDARFIGAPTDLIVFDGLSEGSLRQIVFVEIKTNKSQLNQREKQIRDIINKGLVKWEEIRHMISEVVK